MIDLELPNDDTETIVVCSGGGTRGYFQWLLLLKIAIRFKISMLCGTSAGALNVYAFGKGPAGIEFASKIWPEIFASNGAPITGPGLGEIKNGKLSVSWANIKKYLLDGINLWDFVKAIGRKGKESLGRQFLNNFLSAPAILNNAPLYDRIRELQTLNPGWDFPTYWNRVDMRTGKLDECGWDDGRLSEDEIDSVVASSTIPILWPLVKNRYADGGLREGTPLDQIFRKLDVKKKYRIIMIECTSDEMPEDTTLNNPLDLASQTLNIMMNESRQNDVKGILDKNEEAREKGEILGRRFVQFYRLRYTGTKSSLDFSPDAAKDFERNANEVWETFIKAYDKVA